MPFYRQTLQGLRLYNVCMDSSTIDRLRALNNEFYADNAQSFSASRNSPWPGWKRIAAHIGERPALDVLDIACGNLRFERYIADELGEDVASFTCVDSCPELVRAGLECEYINADVVQMLDGSLPFAKVLGGSRFDLAVSFGFLHHVPGARLREKLLDEMAEVVKPGGLMAVSLWRFATFEKLAKKAENGSMYATLGSLGVIGAGVAPSGLRVATDPSMDVEVPVLAAVGEQSVSSR